MPLPDTPVSCQQCALQHCPGLRPLDHGQLAAIERFKQGDKVAIRGQVVIAQGAPLDHLFTLYRGVMIRYRELPDGRRQIVNFMFPGDLVGLQGVFSEPSSHTIEALLDSRLCMFARRDFHDLIVAHPHLGYDLTWLAAKEETILEDHIVSLGQRSAKEKVTNLAVWLLDRAIATGLAEDTHSVSLPITQAQIADMLGLSLVHTNRTIRALEREGLVEWKSRTIRVPDMDRACEYAHFNRQAGGPKPFI